MECQLSLIGLDDIGDIESVEFHLGLQVCTPLTLTMSSTPSWAGFDACAPLNQNGFSQFHQWNSPELLPLHTLLVQKVL